jgi:hypothetical protein
MNELKKVLRARAKKTHTVIDDVVVAFLYVLQSSKFQRYIC